MSLVLLTGGILAGIILDRVVVWLQGKLDD